NVIAEFMRSWGNVTVVAPSEPQSAKSAALTLNREMAMRNVCESASSRDKGSLRMFSFSGTPADCVKVSMNSFFNLKSLPDLLISGINHGSNASIASLYSGTLGACAEATAYGIPSIGLSLNSHSCDPDFGPMLHFIPEIIGSYLKNPPRKGVYLNINFPCLPIDRIKGVRMAHQGYGQWVQEFDKTREEDGVTYYMMTGSFINYDENVSADHLLVEDGYVSIVPHLLDTTDYSESERIGKLWRVDQFR
ncbi:MAG: 5'/3'-nucleotidase SurE, partial [Bacteroidales bacterium]